MKSNLPTISPLRHQLDILGAQFHPDTQVDPVLVGVVCRNIVIAANDQKQPLPDDIFAPGMNEQLMRCALSGLCMVTMQMVAPRVNGSPQR